MTFHAANFRTADELVNFVNDNAVAQANITAIREKDGGWWLFYWA